MPLRAAPPIRFIEKTLSPSSPAAGSDVALQHRGRGGGPRQKCSHFGHFIARLRPPGRMRRTGQRQLNPGSPSPRLRGMRVS